MICTSAGAISLECFFSCLGLSLTAPGIPAANSPNSSKFKRSMIANLCPASDLVMQKCRGYSP